jgi:signal peptide peptidase SppA
VAGSDTIAEALRNAAADDSVKAVILRVNSPGGSGSASDVIAREVENTVAEKPVIVSMGDYAASGGYYVSAPATTIVADPTTITGSIGVFFGKFVLKGMFEKVGVTHDYVDFGKGGSFASATRRWSLEDQAKVEGLASRFYDRFLSLVAENRNMDVDAVHEVAQGRVWTGGPGQGGRTCRRTRRLRQGFVDRQGEGEDRGRPGCGGGGFPRAQGSLRSFLRRGGRLGRHDRARSPFARGPCRAIPSAVDRTVPNPLGPPPVRLRSSVNRRIRRGHQTESSR